MSIIGPPKISGHTIFCDDIRPELGDKFSFIGVYQSVMFIHGDYPFTIPKFGISIKYVELAGTCSHPLALKLFLLGDSKDIPTMSANINIEELRIQAANMASGGPQDNFDGDDQPKYYSLVSHFILAPMIIKQNGSIRVRAFCGDDIVKMGALRIEKVPTWTA
jgi:hypothetical protein